MTAGVQWQTPKGWTFLRASDARATMQDMAANVKSALRDADIVRIANNIVADVPIRDRRLQSREIAKWLGDRFRFISDPVNVELLRTPRAALGDILTRGFTQGDCDEASMLTATLAMANGMPTRFRALAFGGPQEPFRHVLTDVFTQDGWTPVDVTARGVNRPPVTRTLIYGV